MTISSVQDRLDYMSIIYGIANGTIEDDHDCKGEKCQTCIDINLAKKELDTDSAYENDKSQDIFDMWDDTHKYEHED